MYIVICPYNSNVSLSTYLHSIPYDLDKKNNAKCNCNNTDTGKKLKEVE